MKLTVRYAYSSWSNIIALGIGSVVTLWATMDGAECEFERSVKELLGWGRWWRLAWLC